MTEKHDYEHFSRVTNVRNAREVHCCKATPKPPDIEGHIVSYFCSAAVIVAVHMHSISANGLQSSVWPCFALLAGSLPEEAIFRFLARARNYSERKRSW